MEIPGGVFLVAIIWGIQLLVRRSKRRQEKATLTEAENLLVESRARDQARDQARRQQLLGRLAADIHQVTDRVSSPSA